MTFKMNFFRYFWAIAVMALGLLVVSCEPESDNETQSYSIVGVWELVPNASTPPEDKGLRITFNADGTYQQYEPTTKETQSGKYSYTKDRISISVAVGTRIVNYTLPIRELTASKLVVETEDEEGDLMVETYKRIQ